MPKLGKKQKGHVCTIECPYCAKIVDVIKEEVISPAVKAEKKVTYHGEKSVQTSLSIGEP